MHPRYELQSWHWFICTEFLCECWGRFKLPASLRFFCLPNRIYFRLIESVFQEGRNFLSPRTNSSLHPQKIDDPKCRRRSAAHELLDSMNSWWYEIFNGLLCPKSVILPCFHLGERIWIWSPLRWLLRILRWIHRQHSEQRLTTFQHRSCLLGQLWKGSDTLLDFAWL